MTQYIRFSEIKKLIGISRSTIWRLEQKGKFPKRHKISPIEIAWLSNEVEDWINKHINIPGSIPIVSIRRI